MNLDPEQISVHLVVNHQAALRAFVLSLLPGSLEVGVQLMFLVQRPKRIAKVEMDTGESDRAFEIAGRRLRHPQLVEAKGEDVCIFRDAFGEGGAHAVARG
jgi:hypothetical protein